MKNDSQTVWNENKRKSEKQKRLADYHRQDHSVENDLRFANRMATVDNDREVYNTIFGRPGDYPAFD